MILVIDNYDSFTFNLVQALEASGATVRVMRNDAIDRSGIEALAEDEAADLNGIVISPGPGDPDDAGVSMDAVRIAIEREIPLLGVCLGMQSMAQVYGASIVRAPTLVHGEAAGCPTTAPACSKACRRSSWPRATTRCASMPRRSRRTCASRR